MAKASLTMPSGAVVQIEGSPEEVRELLKFYETSGAPTKLGVLKVGRRPGPVRPGASRGERVDEKAGAPTANLTEIVNLVKTCDEAEGIERQILDRSSQVDRTLLPLYIVHENLDNAFGLSSGDINKITKDLGVPVSQPNASRTLSGTAKKYVVGDRVRKKGPPVRYKLSRRGVQYVRALIRGTADENAG